MPRILLVALFCAHSGSLPATDRDPSAFIGVVAGRAGCICRRSEPVAFIAAEIPAFCDHTRIMKRRINAVLAHLQEARHKPPSQS